MMEIVNQLRGHVVALVETPFPERFLNICAQQGLQFWDLERVDACTLRVCMLPSGYKKLRGFVEKLGCRVRLERKRGAPFFMRRFRKRYALVLGGLLCAALLYGMSLFVWELEVVGNERLSSAAILQKLDEIGVGVGTCASDISIDEIQVKMLLKMDDLAWITVNVRGSRATVEVRERVAKPMIIDRNAPCNIIAGKPGMIESIDALAGSAKVVAGQTVDAGQMLVSGVIDSMQAGARFVRADARVKARTWYDVEGRLLTQSAGKHYTGKSKTRNTLVIAGRRYPLYSDASVPFDRYDKMVTRYVLQIGGIAGLPGVTFPVTLVTEYYTEYTETEMTVNPLVADAQLRTSLGLRLHEMLGAGDITQVEIETDDSGGVLTGRIRAECLEEIAVRADVLTGMALAED